MSEEKVIKIQYFVHFVESVLPKVSNSADLNLNNLYVQCDQSVL